MSKEVSQLIKLGDFVVDLFITDSGNLGLTVEKAPAHEDNTCVDIFVNSDTLEVVSEK